MSTPAWVSGLRRDGDERIIYQPAAGSEALSVLVADAWAIPFESVEPVRRIRSFKGQKNFCGAWWMATTKRHVTFESWVERDFLISADFDNDVVGVASQPFVLEYVAGGAVRVHTPDFFLRATAGHGVVVDVRPDHLIAPGDQEKFEATDRMCGEVGWSYRRVGELPGVYVANLRWLAGYRHERTYRETVGSRIRAAVRGSDGMSIGALADTAGDPVVVLPTVFHMMWRRELDADLTGRRMSMTTTVTLGGVA